MAALHRDKALPKLARHFRTQKVASPGVSFRDVAITITGPPRGFQYVDAASISSPTENHIYTHFDFNFHHESPGGERALQGWVESFFHDNNGCLAFLVFSLVMAISTRPSSRFLNLVDETTTGKSFLSKFI